MLARLHIKDFAIIQMLTIDFSRGLNVITGETGAGKSIILEALNLLLGARVDSKLLHDKRCTTITAHFDIIEPSPAHQWLKQQAWGTDNTRQCILHREITKQGRSYHYINNRPCALQDLRKLSQHLIHSHHQHQQQQLLKNDYQRILFDQYANLRPLQQAVSECYRHWLHTKQQLEKITMPDTHQQQQAWLQYQYQELTELLTTCGDLELLQQTHQQLSHAEHHLQQGQACLTQLQDTDHNPICSQVQQVLKQLMQLQAKTDTLNSCCNLLQQAGIYLDEASEQLTAYLAQIVVSPQGLAEIDQKLAQLHAIARKHDTSIDNLPTIQSQLATQQAQLTLQAEQETVLQQQLEQHLLTYNKLAMELSQARMQAARPFNQKMTHLIRQLGIPHAQFEVKIVQDGAQSSPPKPHGHDAISFLIAPNPGYNAQPLNKIASGGELSRISLATALVTTPLHHASTFIFDEVDVGISGAVGEMVGQMLQQLAQGTQIICITHLPQVAMLADTHWKIHKQHREDATQLKIHNLDSSQRVEEIARMLGGITITEETRQHATTLLQQASAYKADHSKIDAR